MRSCSKSSPYTASHRSDSVSRNARSAVRPSPVRAAYSCASNVRSCPSRTGGAAYKAAQAVQFLFCDAVSRHCVQPTRRRCSTRCPRFRRRSSAAGTPLSSAINRFGRIADQPWRQLKPLHHHVHAGTKRLVGHHPHIAAGRDRPVHRHAAGHAFPGGDHRIWYIAPSARRHGAVRQRAPAGAAHAALPEHQYRGRSAAPACGCARRASSSGPASKTARG